MRKTIIFVAAIALLMTAGLGFGYAQTASNQGYARGNWHSPWQGTGNGYARPAGSNWYCPWGGAGYQRGPAPARGYGRMGYGCGGYGGYGMMSGGWGPGSRYGQGYRPSWQGGQRR